MKGTHQRGVVAPEHNVTAIAPGRGEVDVVRAQPLRVRVARDLQPRAASQKALLRLEITSRKGLLVWLHS